MFRAFRQTILSLFVICLSFLIFAATSENGRYLGWLAHSVDRAQEISRTASDSVTDVYRDLSIIVNRAFAADTSKSTSTGDCRSNGGHPTAKPASTRSNTPSVAVCGPSAEIQRLSAVLLWLFS